MRRSLFTTRGEVFVIAVYFAVAMTSILLTRNSAGSSLLWPANAITAAFLVRLPAVRWGRVFVGVLCSGVLANVLGAHDAPLGSLAMASVDLLDVGLTACLFRFYARLPFPNITVVSGLQLLALVGIAIPAVVALAGAAAVSLTFGTSFWPDAANWYTATAAGAILCAPSIYLYSSKALQRLVAPEARTWNLLLAIVSLVVTYCAIRYARFPLVVLSIPLIVVAFQVGAFGAALMCELVGLLVVILWSTGVRPLGTPVA
ncbi:MAG TPA: MASE1 domain-containing protein, partial [Steroidobacteraceae bacterium]